MSSPDRTFGESPQRDRINVRTPMRCPLCGGELERVYIRDMGSITAGVVWQLHAGRCAAHAEHGWFQAEVVGKPPREIFAVERPFGPTKRLEVDGQEVYAFATVWNDTPSEVQMRRVDPLDPQYWTVRRHAYTI
jgi:hypothetical protein